MLSSVKPHLPQIHLEVVEARHPGRTQYMHTRTRCVKEYVRYYLCMQYRKQWCTTIPSVIDHLSFFVLSASTSLLLRPQLQQSKVRVHEESRFYSKRTARTWAGHAGAGHEGRDMCDVANCSAIYPNISPLNAHHVLFFVLQFHSRAAQSKLTACHSVQ